MATSTEDRTIDSALRAELSSLGIKVVDSGGLPAEGLLFTAVLDAVKQVLALPERERASADWSLFAAVSHLVFVEGTIRVVSDRDESQAREFAVVAVFEVGTSPGAMPG